MFLGYSTSHHALNWHAFPLPQHEQMGQSCHYCTEAIYARQNDSKVYQEKGCGPEQHEEKLILNVAAKQACKSFYVMTFASHSKPFQQEVT